MLVIFCQRVTPRGIKNKRLYVPGIPQHGAGPRCETGQRRSATPVGGSRSAVWYRDDLTSRPSRCRQRTFRLSPLRFGGNSRVQTRPACPSKLMDSRTSRYCARRVARRRSRSMDCQSTVWRARGQPYINILPISPKSPACRCRGRSSARGSRISIYRQTVAPGQVSRHLVGCRATHTPKVEGALYGTRAPTDRATPLDKQQTNTEPVRFTSGVTQRDIR